MAIAFLFAIAASSLPPHLSSAWLEFSREPANGSSATRVELGTAGYDQRRKQLQFWARRTVRDRNEERVSWADSRTCPAMGPILARLRDVPVPRFAPIGVSAGPRVMIDGISYFVRTYSDEGRLTAETNMGTPVAAWIEQSLAGLEPCWSSAVPAPIETP